FYVSPLWILVDKCGRKLGMVCRYVGEPSVVVGIVGPGSGRAGIGRVNVEIEFDFGTEYRIYFGADGHLVVFAVTHGSVVRLGISGKGIFHFFFATGQSNLDITDRSIL